MAAWKYIKGNSSHFSGAPDWAIYYVEVKRENGRTTRAWEGDDYRYCYTPTSEGSEEPMKEFTGSKGVIAYKWFEAELEIVAQRERVTSINDDRLAQDVNALITERGNRYGKFKDGAEIMRDLKQVMQQTEGWSRCTSSQKEALDMIQHKIGRILNGDPTYDDSWKDIAGYATLIVEELNGVSK